MKRFIFKLIVLSSLFIIFQMCALNLNPWTMHHVVKPEGLINKQLTYFTEGNDTLRFFIRSLESGTKYIDIRFWAVFPKLEEEIDSTAADTIAWSDVREEPYKIISYPDQLKLLDLFLKDFLEHNHDSILKGLSFELSGTGDANVDVSRRFPSDGGLKELKEVLSTSMLRRDIDSILSRYDYRVSSVEVEEAIFGLYSKENFMKRNIIDNINECPDSIIEAYVLLRLEDMHNQAVRKE